MVFDLGLCVFLAAALAMPLVSATLIVVKAYQDRKAKTAVTLAVQQSTQDHPLQGEESEPDVCSICLCALVYPEWPVIMEAEESPAQPIVALKKCRHAFHVPCIIPWISRGHTRCPVCRQRYGF